MKHHLPTRRTGGPIVVVWVTLCLVLQAFLAGLWAEPAEADVDPLLAGLGVVLCKTKGGSDAPPPAARHADTHCFQHCLTVLSGAAPIVPPVAGIPHPLVLYPASQLSATARVLPDHAGDAHRARGPPDLLA